MKAAILSIVFAALGSVAWMCQRGGESQSAEADLVIAGLGGFRGLAWPRAAEAHEQHRGGCTGLQEDKGKG
jgi:hypothetical protein